MELGAYGHIERILYIDQEGYDPLVNELREDQLIGWYDEKIKLKVWRSQVGR